MSDLVHDIVIEGMEEQLQRLTQYDQVTNRHMVKAMHEAVTMAEAAIIPKVPVGISGRLKNSIGSQVLETGPGSIIGKVGSSLKDEEYPKVMEFGRKPGKMPPVDALVPWVHRKRIAGSYSIKTKRRLGGRAQQGSEDRAVAYMIARSIGRKGIKGHFFMKQGYEKVKGKILNKFKKALNEIAKEMSIGH
jgi:hypothetical protein